MFGQKLQSQNKMSTTDTTLSNNKLGNALICRHMLPSVFFLDVLFWPNFPCSTYDIFAFAWPPVTLVVAFAAGTILTSNNFKFPNCSCDVEGKRVKLYKLTAWRGEMDIQGRKQTQNLKFRD